MTSPKQLLVGAAAVCEPSSACGPQPARAAVRTRPPATVRDLPRPGVHQQPSVSCPPVNNPVLFGRSFVAYDSPSHCGSVTSCSKHRVGRCGRCNTVESAKPADTKRDFPVICPTHTFDCYVAVYTAYVLINARIHRCAGVERQPSPRHGSLCDRVPCAAATRRDTCAKCGDIDNHAPCNPASPCNPAHTTV